MSSDKKSQSGRLNVKQRTRAKVHMEHSVYNPSIIASKSLLCGPKETSVVSPLNRGGYALRGTKEEPSGGNDC